MQTNIKTYEYNLTIVMTDSFIIPHLKERIYKKTIPSKKPKASLFTLGCRQNQYDTERIREDLEATGWLIDSKVKNPDCIIVNTCSVTSSAERQARNILNRLLRENPNTRVIMTGCYARNNPDIDPRIDILPSKRDIVIEFNLKSSNHITKFSEHTKAFVSIQDGCDKFCSYCIIPYLRGKPVSRPEDEIENEIRALTARGYRAFVLTGINLGSYNHRGSDLLSLLRHILDIDGVELLGISSIEPETITPSLIEFVSLEDRFYRWLHISLQSGCDKILRLMGRDYTVEDEIKMIDMIKDKMSDVCIGADIICGFPGETDRDFDETRMLLARSPLSYFHVFRYSPRKGTRAYGMKDRPCTEITKERSRIIRDIGKKKFYEFRKKSLKKEMRVLVEKRRVCGLLVGVTDNYIKVLFEGPDDLMNNFVTIKIEKVESERTLGKLVLPCTESEY